jgi:hypothetical protein
LKATGDLEKVETAQHDVFDAVLEEAVKRFQRRHGLDDDGVVGQGTLAALNVPAEDRARQIVLNLERWRWLPRDLGDGTFSSTSPGSNLMLLNMIGWLWKCGWSWEDLIAERRCSSRR